jgi:hypothetical protein
VPSQAYETQVRLDEIANAQARSNAEFGAQIDRSQNAFFTNQDIRSAQAAAGEQRTTIGKQGEEERATIGARYAGETALAETQGAQQRLGIAATGEETRKTTVTQGEQQRLGIAATGEETRKTTVTAGEQQRLGIKETGSEERATQKERYAGETALAQTQGEQQRLGIQTTGSEERKTVETTGAQQRETIGKTATEQRSTDLQQEMFRRYKENRDYEQAQNQYRT